MERIVSVSKALESFSKSFPRCAVYFAKFERVFYADSKKVMTVKKGKYTTYSAEDWKVTDEKKADEIKDGGKYTFEACGEYVFVFDDNTGECIDRIAV